MKNILRQYWLPALITVILHLVAADAFIHWLRRPHIGSGGLIEEDPLPHVVLLPDLPDVHTFHEDGLDDFEATIVANSDYVLRIQAPPCLCCRMHIWEVPPTYVRPEAHVQIITRINGLEMPEQRLVVGLIDSTLNHNIRIFHENTRNIHITGNGLNEIPRYTTRIPWLGGRR